MRAIYDTEGEAVSVDALALAFDKQKRIENGTMDSKWDTGTTTYSIPTERLDGRWDIECCDGYDYENVEEYDAANYPVIDVD